jgi:hypothetical protein
VPLVGMQPIHREINTHGGVAQEISGLRHGLPVKRLWRAMHLGFPAPGPRGKDGYFGTFVADTDEKALEYAPPEELVGGSEYRYQAVLHIASARTKKMKMAGISTASCLLGIR